VKHEQAAQLVAQIKAGKRFYTRFQEEQWGVYYAPGAGFIKWSRHYGEEIARQPLTEKETLQLFARYRFENLRKKLYNDTIQSL